MAFKHIEKNIQLLTQQVISAKEYFERLKNEHSTLERNIHSTRQILMEVRSTTPTFKRQSELGKNELLLTELLNQFAKVGINLLEARKKYHNLTQELAREHFVLEQKRHIA